MYTCTGEMLRFLILFSAIETGSSHYFAFSAIVKPSVYDGANPTMLDFLFSTPNAVFDGHHRVRCPLTGIYALHLSIYGQRCAAIVHESTEIAYVIASGGQASNMAVLMCHKGEFVWVHTCEGTNSGTLTQPLASIFSGYLINAIST